jgi:hypothetical protein
VHAGHFLPDANGVASLLDGRIRNRFVQPLPRTLGAETRGPNIAVDVHLAVGAASDVDIARGVGQFQADGPLTLKLRSKAPVTKGPF